MGETRIDPLRDVITEVESRLYYWGALQHLKLDDPVPPISSVWSMVREYGKKPPSKSNQRRSSQQEQWVVSMDASINTVRAVNNVLRRMAPLDQKVVRMRYADGMGWKEVAEVIGMPEDYAKRNLKERILYAFALEFGLLQGATKKPQSN